jgi:hypothetical protein
LLVCIEIFYAIMFPLAAVNRTSSRSVAVAFSEPLLAIPWGWLSIWAVPFDVVRKANGKSIEWRKGMVENRSGHEKTLAQHGERPIQE